MNNLCFFQEIGLCDKKEILELAKKIVKALNEAFPPEELKKIWYYINSDEYEKDIFNTINFFICKYSRS